MPPLNWGQILQEGVLAEEVATELFSDVTELQNNQPASVSAPVSVFGHPGTLSVSWTPAIASSTPAGNAETAAEGSKPAQEGAAHDA